nr:FMN-binding protein [uncultured Blautia sp.]
MKNKEVKGILALVVVTALSFGVIIGSKSLAISAGGDSAAQSAEALEELDVSGAENIEKASKTSDGYLVTVRTKGYVGDIVMDVAFDESASKITGVQVVEQSETDGLGSKIAEAEFLDQFKGVEAPVYLPGMDVSAETDSAEEEAAPEEAEDLSILEGASLADGTYEAKTEAPDSNGFIDVVTLTVKDGAITEASWDAVTEDGSKKSIMSENGEYTMTEDGLTWKEQAEALASALIENQSLSFLNTDAEGKTDAVSGVSISVNGFIDLAAQCMKQAAGLEDAPADPFAGATLTDGTYEAKTEAPDSNGFTDVVTLTVKDGAITEASWDAVTEDGSKKSIMSENGEYTMTEDGLTWKEQAEALASALIENQSLSFLNTDAEGKTDAVSGVSISVNGFIDLATRCLEEASGIQASQPEAEEAPEEEAASEETADMAGTEIDAISGATMSSTAAVTGINEAYDFLQTVK